MTSRMNTMTYQLPGQIAPFTIHCTIIIMYRSLIYCPLKQWWRISKSYQMEKFEKFLRGHGRVKWKWKFKWQVKCYNILYRSIDSRSHLDGICSCWASHLVGALKFPWTFESHVLFDFEPLILKILNYNLDKKGTFSLGLPYYRAGAIRSKLPFLFLSCMNHCIGSIDWVTDRQDSINFLQ